MGVKDGGKAYIDSWKKNPLENIATGGNVALYKGGAGAIGVKAPTSSSMGVPSLFAKAKTVDGFEMPQSVAEAEKQMIQRQAAIAAGAAPSIAEMAMNKNVDLTNRAAMAMAASQRGASNPMLAFRQAQIQGQEAQLQGAQDGAMMAEQERRQADQMIAAQAAAQRGVALQASMANQQAKTAAENSNRQMIAGLAGTAGKMAMGAAHGAVVPGEPIVEGDHPVNDTVPYMLSPGEVVVPRSAAKNGKTLKMFLDKIKLEEKLKKAGA